MEEQEEGFSYREFRTPDGDLVKTFNNGNTKIRN